MLRAVVRRLGACCSVYQNTVGRAALRRYFGRVSDRQLLQQYEAAAKSNKPLAPADYIRTIDIFAQDGRLDRAFEVFKTMRAANVNVDSSIYAAYFAACRLNNNSSEALRVWQEMKSANIPLTTDVANALISVFGYAGQLQEVRNVYEELKKAGKPDGSTVRQLLKIFSINKDPENLRTLYNEMRSGLCRPTLTDYDFLVRALCENAYWEDAWQVHTDRQYNTVGVPGYSRDNVKKKPLKKYATSYPGKSFYCEGGVPMEVPPME